MKQKIIIFFAFFIVATPIVAVETIADPGNLGAHPHSFFGHAQLSATLIPIETIIETVK